MLIKGWEIFLYFGGASNKGVSTLSIFWNLYRNKILDDGFLISSINKPFYASCNFPSMSSPRQSLAIKMQGYCLFTTSFISNLRRIYFYIRSFLTYNGKAEKKDHRNYWRKSRIHNFVSLLLALLCLELHFYWRRKRLTNYCPNY